MKKLNEITPWYVEQYKKTRKEAELAPPTINYELALLKGLLRKSHEWGNLVNAPDLTVKKLKAEESRTRFLSEEEETHFLTVCTPALSRVVKTGLLTGFRRQELVNLRPEDINFERGTVRVAACFAKNGESRTLPLSPRLHAVLAEAMSARGTAPVVFTTAQGNPWTVTSLSSAFKRAGRKAELQNFGPHVLRHTFASRLVMAGVDLRTVQELMGHKSIAMTVRYAHLSQGHKRAAMEALESRFSEKSPANFRNTPSDGSFAPQEKVIAFR
jgi:integrase